jgi:hypothetical protein
MGGTSSVCALQTISLLLVTIFPSAAHKILALTPPLEPPFAKHSMFKNRNDEADTDDDVFTNAARVLQPPPLATLPRPCTKAVEDDIRDTGTAAEDAIGKITLTFYIPQLQQRHHLSSDEALQTRSMPPQSSPFATKSNAHETLMLRALEWRSEGWKLSAHAVAHDRVQRALTLMEQGLRNRMGMGMGMDWKH